MASLLSPPNFVSLTTPPTSSSSTHIILNLRQPLLKLVPSLAVGTLTHRFRRPFAVVAEEVAVTTRDPNSEAARRLYVGNIPRTVTNDELAKILEEHGAVEKAQVMYDKYSGRSRRFAFVTMKTVEDANAVIEKLNGTVEESENIDSPHKVYVGNLAKTVTTDTLKSFFSEKGKVLSAKVSRVPGTSKSSGFGFVTFSSAEDVEAAISSFNNSLLEAQKIRVNKA
ncbi:small ribosomal subunit protein cS22 isoform X2 [Gastrolobium bilobum]|uniref:small ribosomal subunit protein cS22 isoform X2 n=1 Tax=Gastrolobium bilobum TaxID=150636 RepID=UPI002AAF11F1|nr:small ribosomal subunit protein cS22 isoform X2 [Gastrolobium bilobum]